MAVYNQISSNRDFAQKIWNSFSDGKAITSDRNYNLVYPAKLMGEAGGSVPVMLLNSNSARSNIGQGLRSSIYLPMPVGLDFSDGASYNDAELGVMGTAALNAVRAVKENGVSGAAQKAISQLGGSDGISALVKQASGAAGSLGLSALPESAAQGVGIGLGSQVNKNITTEFTGVSTRAYSFQYKMVASSQGEAETISLITKALRLGMYPEKDSEFILKYPPTWTIRFLKGGNDLKHIPKIFECYLTDVKTTFNQSAASFFKDGAPVEVDLSFSFKETRALTADDIIKLEQTSA